MARHGAPPVLNPDLVLSGAHVTVAHPRTTEGGKILEQVDSYREALLGNTSRRCIVVRSAKNLDNASPDDRLHVVFGLQHPPEEAVTAAAMKPLYDAGVRVSTVAYEKSNRFGGGFAAPDAPLTEDGKRFLDVLTELGMILDLSHAGHRTAREALAHIAHRGLHLRVMASHTGCFAVHEHGRNLPDDVLRQIFEMDGVVGIYNLTFGLDPVRNDLGPIYEHLLHARTLAGSRGHCIGIGSDGIYQTVPEEELRALYERLSRELDGNGSFKSRFPTDPLVLNTPARMLVLEGQLVRRGMEEAEVARILGDSIRQFFQRALR